MQSGEVDKIIISRKVILMKSQRKGPSKRIKHRATPTVRPQAVQAPQLKKGRHHFIIGGSIGLTVAAAIAAALALRNAEDPASLPPPTVSVPASLPPHVSEKTRNMPPDDIEVTDRAIESTDVGMATFKARIQYGNMTLFTPWAASNYRMPFDTMDENRKNSQRNGPRAAKNLGLHKGEGVTVTTKNQFHYFYWASTNSATNGSQASFQPVSRIMKLDENIDPDNMLDMSTLFHELVHANLTVNMQPADIALYEEGERDGKARLLINDEGAAWALQIESLNVLLNDAIRQYSRTGVKPSIVDVRRTLRAKPEKDFYLEQIFTFGREYYHGDLLEHPSNALPFLNTIAKTYETSGDMEMYIKMSNGKIQRFIPQ